MAPDVAIDEQVADRLRSRFSDESLKAGYPSTIDEALSIPIEEARDAFEKEGFLDTVVDDALEAFVEMVIGLSEDVHERMEQRQERCLTGHFQRHRSMWTADSFRTNPQPRIISRKSTRRFSKPRLC